MLEEKFLEDDESTLALNPIHEYNLEKYKPSLVMARIATKMIFTLHKVQIQKVTPTVILA